MHLRCSVIDFEVISQVIRLTFGWKTLRSLQTLTLEFISTQFSSILTLKSIPSNIPNLGRQLNQAMIQSILICRRDFTQQKQFQFERSKGSELIDSCEKSGYLWAYWRVLRCWILLLIIVYTQDYQCLQWQLCNKRGISIPHLSHFLKYLFQFQYRSLKCQLMDHQSKQKGQNLEISQQRPLPVAKKQKVVEQSHQIQRYREFVGQFCILTNKQRLVSKLLDQHIFFSQKRYYKRIHVKEMSFSDNEEMLVLTVCYGFIQAQVNLLLVNDQSETHQLNGEDGGAFGNIYAGIFQRKKIVIKCISFKQKTFIETLQSVLKEFLLNKIASCLQSGPLPIKNYFDIIVYSSCIEFFQQKCNRNDETNIDTQKMRLDLSLALKKLHSLHIVHLDIKAENICFSPEQKRYVFIDYGMSQIVSEQFGYLTLTAFKGSVKYCSPDMFALYDNKTYIQRAIDLYYNDAYGLNQVIKQLGGVNSQQKEGDLQAKEQLLMQYYLDKQRLKKPDNLFQKYWLRVLKYYFFIKSQYFNGFQQMVFGVRKMISIVRSSEIVQRNIQQVLILKNQKGNRMINQQFFAICFGYLSKQEESRFRINSYESHHKISQRFDNVQKDNSQPEDNKETKGKSNCIRQHYLSVLAADEVSMDPLNYSPFSLQFLTKNVNLIKTQQQRNIYLLQVSYSLQIINNQYSYQQRETIASSLVNHLQIGCKIFRNCIYTCINWLFNKPSNDDQIKAHILFNLIESVIILELVDQQQLQKTFNGITALKITHLFKLKLIFKFLKAIHWITQKISTKYQFYQLQQHFIKGLIDFRQSLKQDSSISPYMGLVSMVLQYRLQNKYTNFSQLFYTMTTTSQGNIRSEFYIEKQLDLKQTRELLRQIQQYVTYIHFDYVRYSRFSNYLHFQYLFMLFESLEEINSFPLFQQFSYGHVILTFYLNGLRKHGELLNEMSNKFTVIFQKYQQYDNLLIRWDLALFYIRILPQHDLELKLNNMRKIKWKMESCHQQKKTTIFWILIQAKNDVISSPNSEIFLQEIEKIMRIDERTFREVFYINVYQENNIRREFHRHKLYRTMLLLTGSFVYMLRLKNHKKTLEQFGQAQIAQLMSYKDYLVRQIKGFYCLECQELALFQITRFIRVLYYLQKKYQLMFQLTFEKIIYYFRQNREILLIQHICLLFQTGVACPEIGQKFQFSEFFIDAFEKIDITNKQFLLHRKNWMQMLLLSILEDSIELQAKFIQLLVSTLERVPAQNNILNFYFATKNAFYQIIRQKKIHILLQLATYIKCIKNSPICLMFQVIIQLLPSTQKGLSRNLMKKTALLLNNADKQTKKIVFRDYFKRYTVLFDVKNSRQKKYIKRKNLKSAIQTFLEAPKSIQALVNRRTYRASKSCNFSRQLMKRLQKYKALL